MTTLSNTPFYIKFTMMLVGMIAVMFILYMGKGIIVPFIFSAFIAILVNPLVDFLIRKKCNRVVAILLSVLLTLVIIAGLVVFISSQLVTFSDSFPQFKVKFEQTSTDLISWFSEKFNVRKKEINQWLNEAQAKIGERATAGIGLAVMTIGSTLLLIFIMPVYIFLILFYKPLFLEFIHKIFAHKDQKAVGEVLNGTNTVIKGYLRGLMFEIGIVTTLNSVGLLLLGVDYAILLGITGGLFNLIPYVGIFLALFMSVTVAFITNTTTTVLLVIVLYIVVQFIDNNILVPYVVASQVKINAIISILAVITGNLIWGVAGMFLSIPIVALIKVICDHIEPLKPWGYLLGDDMRLAKKKDTARVLNKVSSKQK